VPLASSGGDFRRPKRVLKFNIGSDATGYSDDPDGNKVYRSRQVAPVVRFEVFGSHGECTKLIQQLLYYKTSFCFPERV
jgi:hypothetical protein